MSYEAWGEPPDYDPHPLEAVEFPRERKPGKRDREAVRSQMQGAINQRCWANPMIVDSRGQPGSLSKDHSLGFRELNHVHSAIMRYRWESRGKSRSWRLNALAGLHRCLELVPYYDRPPLP